MALPSLWNWGRGREVPIRREEASQPMGDLYFDMNRLFDEFWSDLVGGLSPALGLEATSFAPRMDVEETDSEIRVNVELPGLDEKDFELSLDRDALTVRGEKREEREVKRQGWFHRECRYGSFSRRVPLPCEIDADRAEARFRNGVLRITLPKSEEARRSAVHIPVITA